MIAEARPSLDETLLHVAYAWSRRGTCSRAYVGAVLAVDGRTVASGYNGAPAGTPHCEHRCTCDVFGDTRPGVTHRTDCEASRPCLVAVHAEANAVAFAARYGVRTDGATLYTTLTPCRVCAALLVNAGVIRVVSSARYRDPAGDHVLAEAGVPLVLFDADEVGP